MAHQQQDAPTATARSMAWITPHAAGSDPMCPARTSPLRWDWSGSLGSALDLAVVEALLPQLCPEPVPSAIAPANPTT